MAAPCNSATSTNTTRLASELPRRCRLYASNATAYDFPAVQQKKVIQELFPQTYADSGVMVGFIPNLRKDNFKDVRVRQALSLAVDRQAISDAEMIGLGALEGNWIPEDWPGALARPAPQHNLFRARQLLAEAAYRSGFDVSMLTPQPPFVGPVSPVQQHQTTGLPCPAGTPHFGTFQVESLVRTPLANAKSALTTADETLTTAVRDASSDPAPRRPGPQDDFGDIFISQRVGDWPVPGTPVG